MAAAGAGSGALPGAGTEPLAASAPSSGAGTEPVATGRPSPGGPRSVLGALVSPRTWLAVIHLLVGLVIGIISFTVVVTGISLGIALLPLFLVGIPVLVAVIWLAGLGAGPSGPGSRSCWEPRSRAPSRCRTSRRGGAG